MGPAGVWGAGCPPCWTGGEPGQSRAWPVGISAVHAKARVQGSERDCLLVCAVCQAVASGIHLASLIFSFLIVKQIRMPTPTGRTTRPGEGDSPVGVTSLFAYPVPAPALTPCRTLATVPSPRGIGCQQSHGFCFRGQSPDASVLFHRPGRTDLPEMGS